MKKITLIVTILVSISFHAVSQSWFGVKGGLLLTNQKIKGGGIQLDTKTKIGFSAGLTADIDLGSVFLNTGLEYQKKGSRFKDGGFESVIDLDYLIVPLKINYLLSDAPIFFEVGPYVGVALGGKSIEKFNGDKRETTISFGADEDLLATDIGLSFGAGVKTGMVRFAINYDLGLQNINTDDEVSIKNGVFAFTLGVNLLN